MTNYTARLSTDKGLTWPNNIQHQLTIGDVDRRNDAPIEMSTSNPSSLPGRTNVWKTTNGKDFIKISNFAYAEN
ncbi:MAG: hypothetical protein M9948_08970 [Lentimicrobium sp.]|nr:hypothetical protein [Lentimicrobium sp.]